MWNFRKDIDRSKIGRPTGLLVLLTRSVLVVVVVVIPGEGHLFNKKTHNNVFDAFDHFKFFSISELAGSWKVCLAVVGSSRCKNSKVSDRGVGWLVGV